MASGRLAKTCSAPCTSISRRTSDPSGGRGIGVPIRLPKNSAHSKNSPRSTAPSNVTRSTNS